MYKLPGTTGIFFLIKKKKKKPNPNGQETISTDKKYDLMEDYTVVQLGMMLGTLFSKGVKL